jgi:hypothetical protein
MYCTLSVHRANFLRGSMGDRLGSNCSVRSNEWSRSILGYNFWTREVDGRNRGRGGIEQWGVQPESPCQGRKMFVLSASRCFLLYNRRPFTTESFFAIYYSSFGFQSSNNNRANCFSSNWLPADPVPLHVETNQLLRMAVHNSHLRHHQEQHWLG